MYYSFPTIVNKCLEDIKIDLIVCNAQVNMINEEIDYIEEYIHANPNSHEINKFIKKHDELSLKNSYVLSEQSLLIEYYHKIISMVSRARRLKSKKPLQMSKNQKTIIINNLINFYLEHHEKKKAESLQKYIQII